MFWLQKQGISVLSTSLWSEHCPSGIYSTGTYSSSLPHSSRDIGNPYLDDWLIHHPSVTSPLVSVTHPEHGRPQARQSEIRTRTSSGYPVSGASVILGSGESFPPNIDPE